MILGSVTGANPQLLPSKGGGEDSSGYKLADKHKDPARDYLPKQSRDPQEQEQRYSPLERKAGHLYAPPMLYSHNSRQNESNYEVQDFVGPYSNGRRNAFYDSITMQRYGLAA